MEESDVSSDEIDLSDNESESEVIFEIFIDKIFIKKIIIYNLYMK